MSSEHFLKTKEKIDQVSKSFCLAKWNQVTLHLESGHNHSCHHPKTHLTPRAELKENVAALHNTKFKMAQRKQMLKGERPAECQYCWGVEDLKQEGLFSDRYLKSSESWAIDDLEAVIKNPFNFNHKPRYVEVSFSNTCNFKCSYCSANFSSKWAEELKKFGSYKTNTGDLEKKIIPEDGNPYTEAFWEWWPTVSHEVRVFRITGGEPLLSKNTFRVLENLIQNPNPNLEIAVNSNLGVPTELVQRLIKLINRLLDEKKIKKFTVYTSLESVGTRAEYIRFGLKYELFQKNLDLILANTTNCNIVIMSTFNLLSVTSYKDFLNYILELNKNYSTSVRQKPITVDISYLRNPPYQTVQILGEEFKTYFDEILILLKKSKESNQPYSFGNWEIIKFERLFQWYLDGLSRKDKLGHRLFFYLFFSEHDSRRGTNFLETFPEYAEFWKQCRKGKKRFQDLYMYKAKIKRIIYDFIFS